MRIETQDDYQDYLDTLSQAALLALREQVNACLPPATLHDLDLSVEFAQLLRQSQALQIAIAADKSVPANQKVMVANSVTAVLTTLDKGRDNLERAERVKWLERILLDVIDEFPEMAAAFMSRYEGDEGEKWRSNWVGPIGPYYRHRPRNRNWQLAIATADAN